MIGNDLQQYLRNLDWTSNGDVHTATISGEFVDAIYDLTFNYKDLALNAAAEIKPEQFIVDRTAPDIASSLWKNLPNSIYLVARYSAIISSLFLIKGNSAKKENMLKKNNTIDRMVEILAIFLNEFESSTIGGKK